MTAIRTRQRIATRERILLTARNLFRGASFEQVGVREIAAEAGVATGTVIAAFGSKSDLLHSIVIEDLQLQLPLVKAAVMPFEATNDRIQALCLACFDYQSAQLSIFRASMSDAWTRTMGAEGRVCAAIEPILSFIVAELQRGVARGEILASTNFRLAAQVIFEIVVNSFRIVLYREAPIADLSSALKARLALLLRAFSVSRGAENAHPSHTHQDSVAA